jgi:Arc/MetJ-type ribon-helix-helix transcriptional regulator
MPRRKQAGDEESPKAVSIVVRMQSEMRDSIDFIVNSHKDLYYNQSEYIRQAISEKIVRDRLQDRRIRREVMDFNGERTDKD